MQGLIHPHCSTWFACEEGFVLAIEGAHGRTRYLALRRVVGGPLRSRRSNGLKAIYEALRSSKQRPAD